VLSCLRSYSEADMRELVEGLRAPDYAWETGQAGSGRARVQYLIGRPVRTSTGRAASQDAPEMLLSKGNPEASD